jgi:tetratricopeptide (TPR) repeat protein
VDVAVLTRLAMARRALTGGGGVDAAMAEWTEAIRVSEHAAMTVRTKQAIQRMVLGRAAALADEVGARQGACLDEAITLIRGALPLFGPLAKESLHARLAVLLTDRGIWYGYGRMDYGIPVDLALAEQDLRHALELNPESTRARDNLARALVFGLPKRPGAGTGQAKLAVLAEALAVLNVGLDRAPEQIRFLETLDDLLNELESLLYKNVSISEMRQRMADITSEPELSAPDRAAALAADAERCAADGDWATAAQHLVRATRSDPANGSIRRALLAAVEQLISTNIEGSGSA